MSRRQTKGVVMTARVLLFALTLVAASSTVRAHHSFAATYDEGKTVKIEGRLVQFQFRNPHSFVYITAPDTGGQMQRWTVEWGGGGQLDGQGITRETLRPGDVLVITGNPGRNPADYRVRLVTLLRPSDGFGWGQRAGQVVD
jgi:hypothetical protein